MLKLARKGVQKKVNIELWSDYTCPYCYIGKKRLELAIENLGLSNEISVELKSYQLDSNSIDTKDMNILEYFKEKYKLTDDKVIELVEELAQQAAEVDLAYVQPFPERLRNHVLFNPPVDQAVRHLVGSQRNDFQCFIYLTRGVVAYAGCPHFPLFNQLGNSFHDL